MNAIKTRRRVIQKRKKNDERKRGVFAEIHAVAPAPSRDYCALQLYQKKFVWTRWKISRGPFESPMQKVVSMEEFQRDTTLQNELTYIFGSDTINLIHDLADENWSLVSMPSDILHYILSYISVPDILRLSQVCKRLSKECSKNELWRNICKKEWKILIHNDIEKAGLIGWKRVYMEKMKPKNYKVDVNHPRPNVLQRNRINSISTLSTPDSRSSTVKSNFTIHKRIQELKKSDTLRSTSEIFGKDFKTNSASTGRSTDRTLKGKCSSRNFESRPASSGRMNIASRPASSGRMTIPSRSSVERKYFQQPYSVLNMFPLMENPKPKESARVKSPRNQKCKVTSIRTRPISVNPVASTEFQRGSFITPSLSRPSTGKSVTTVKKKL